VDPLGDLHRAVVPRHGVFGVIVLLSALLPLSIEQRYVIPRPGACSLTWLAKVVCGLGYVIEGQENLPSRPFISLWKHSSVWETLAQMFVVPPASWSLKREVNLDPDRRLGGKHLQADRHQSPGGSLGRQPGRAAGT